MSAIYMIRHGQASFADDHYDALSELGRIQSTILGDYLDHLELTFDAAYSGSLERQRHTARIAMERMRRPSSILDPCTDPGFNEYDAEGVLASQLPDMLKKDPTLARDVDRMNERRSFQRVFERAMMRWISGRYDMTGTETWAAFTARVREAVKRVMIENGRQKRIVLFTSGGVISATMQMALGLADDMALQLGWQLRNTSISIFKYNDERIFLNAFNVIHHLECRKEPHLMTYR
jgi:broad specificity phosphatase PhoE